MRFLANGPSIPDELFLARDQGRVIFFCGAGVSRARVNLPDFFGLAEKVVTKLGVDRNSPAYKLIREAKEIDERVGVSGVISADRVFGLLERDFASRDIEEAVAFALKPPSNCDLSAHNILLDLATTPEGVVQLVTTNFDRLFDDCGRNLKAWMPPGLPDPLRPNDINGIVYLHGRSKPEYSGAEGDGFVLSSSEFGRAYLSDGWATSFIREILGKYVVAFVGYTADDPPVHYLLEALRKASGKLENAFAFQSGEQDDAAARWRYKGVEAIPYNAESAHAALWLSFEAWATRARDPEAWQSKVIKSCKKGPRALQPHERGQVAHIVSTYEGAKKFSEGDNPPPAEWLCVFDPDRRFAKPGRASSLGNEGPYIDPFDSYGLDSDSPPSKIGPEDHYAKREVPTNAWDAFRLNRLDRVSLRDENLALLRGRWAGRSPQLVPRIRQLGGWIARVCDQPAAVWWAAHQVSLHSGIRNQISWELDRSKRIIQPHVRQAWRLLLESWEEPDDDFQLGWHALKPIIERDGWNSAAIRSLSAVMRPYLSVRPDFWGGPQPPAGGAISKRTRRLVWPDVKYPELHEEVAVPDEWLAGLLRVLRQNLELALALETEIGGYGLSNISPIVEDSTLKNDGYSRTHGLSAAVIRYSKYFSRLVTTDKIAAGHEFSSWPANDDTIFARLRIWAAGKRDLVSNSDFDHLLGELSDTAFWDSYHQRDLLIVLADRWKDLSGISRKSIERRLLKGRKRWRREKVADLKQRRAWLILTRIHWLSNAGCEFSFKLDEETKRLSEDAPDWKPQFGDKAAESLESRGGVVKTNTNYEGLLGVPLSSILDRAKDLSGRSDDFLIENDPFIGLAAKHPVRALAALTLAAKRGEFPEWLWRRFLNTDARKSDTARLSGLISRRLATYNDAQLSTIIGPASDWLYIATTNLDIRCTATFDVIAQKLISVLKKRPGEGNSSIVRGNKEPDWTMEAINSPAGKIAEAMFHDPRKNGIRIGQGFPPEWLNNIESLLGLPGDLRRHTLVILFHDLNWFYAVYPKWTKDHLLPVLHGLETHDRDAAWSGFLWGATIPSKELYMLLKADMLIFSVNRLPSRRSYGQVIAAIILAGWGRIDDATGERYVSDDEMRTLLLEVDDEFRSHVLWQAQRWANEKDEGSRDEWAGQLSELLKIWPRQLSARSSDTSARLCELAFSSEEQFPIIADLALPLLTKIERDHLMLPELRKSGDSIIERHPKQALALLYAVLPDNVLAWPYGIEVALQRIGEVDDALRADERLIELRRRWNAR